MPFDRAIKFPRVYTVVILKNMGKGWLLGGLPLCCFTEKKKKKKIEYNLGSKAEKGFK